MGRPQKEKKNYAEQFDSLYKKKGIGGNTDLLKKMYNKYYRDIPGTSRDAQAWIKSQLPDFGKKIKGERPFSESDIKAIERASGMSWVDIVEPLPEESEKNKREKNFEHLSLKLAAFRDEEWCYRELADVKVVDAYSTVLNNYDEYGKTIIDYILDYKAKNGLNFIINEGYIKCSGSLEFDGIYRAEDFSKELWDFIISIDDAELFLKALGEKNLFKLSLYDDGWKEEFLEKIICSKNIFEALCKERVNSENNIGYMPSLLFEALKFSLSKKQSVTAQRIISKYTGFIESRTAEFLEKTNMQGNKDVISHYNRLQTEIWYDKVLIMYAWDLSELDGKCGDFREPIDFCQIQNVIYRLNVKNLSEMEYGESFTKDGIYYIKKKPDIALEALIYLSKEKKCRFLPTYIGEESGVTKIIAYNNREHVEFKELAKMLGEIHSLSQEKLGENKVYMYSAGIKNGLGFTMRGCPIIASWQRCSVGTPISDIVTAILNYFRGNYNSRGTYGYFMEGKANTYEDLAGFLNAYPNKSVIENFGDKFNGELDQMLKDALAEKRDKSNSIIEDLYMIKSFAEIYRADLNNAGMPNVGKSDD